MKPRQPDPSHLTILQGDAPCWGLCCFSVVELSGCPWGRAVCPGCGGPAHGSCCVWFPASTLWCAGPGEAATGRPPPRGHRQWSCWCLSFLLTGSVPDSLPGREREDEVTLSEGLSSFLPKYPSSEGGHGAHSGPEGSPWPRHGCQHEASQPGPQVASRLRL